MTPRSLTEKILARPRLLERIRDLAGLSRVRQEPVAAFLAEWSKDAGRFATWSGELYLERHEGTLTTQARSKRYNRKLEIALREAEWACAKALWLSAHRKDLAAPITPPVVAQGKLLVAEKDAHTIVALDVETGRRLWDFTAGGRIDSPPTVHGGRALFGCTDGWIYCLDASSFERS